jgi:hypothetical protein
MRKRYDYAFLQKFCETNNLILLQDYSNDNLTMCSKIKGKCMNNCENQFEKDLRRLISCGGYCKTCKPLIKLKKYTKTCLEKYGVENVAQTKEVIEKIKKNNLEKYGVEFTTQLETTKEKIKKTNIKKYGVEYLTQSKEIMDKIKQTNIEKHGVEHPSQSNEIMNKIKQTNIEKYGNVCSLYSKETKAKIFEKYGVEYYVKSEDHKKKKEKTCLEKYGIDNYFKTEDFKIKSKETNIKKYGVEYAMQNSEIADKSSKNTYLSKVYTFVSGKQINIQGYENYALDKLLNEDKIDEKDIVTKRSEVPELWYTDEFNKRHRHYVDIYIKSQNNCVEVKSEWTFDKDKENVLLKQKFAKENGYNYEVWIYNSKGIMIKKYS